MKSDLQFLKCPPHRNDTMTVTRNFTALTAAAGNRTINSTSPSEVVVQWSSPLTEKGAETTEVNITESALSHLASLLQMSPWTVAALCCFAYTFIMLLIMALILGSKRAFSNRTTSIFTIATMEGRASDNDELLRSQQYCLFFTSVIHSIKYCKSFHKSKSCIFLCLFCSK